MLALRQSLYREHLEEVSFLYEHRKTALEEPSFVLADIAQLEARAEAHLDALVLGEEAARHVCKTRAEEGDFGEFHGSLRTFCRIDRPDDFVETVAKADADDAQRLAAVADALVYEMPASWTPQVKAWLTDDDAPPHLQAALAIASGHRRLPLGPQLLARARSLKGPELLPYLETLGLLPEPKAAMVLFRFMQQPEHDVGRAAAIAALRLERTHAQPYLQQAISQFSWAPIPLALAAEQQMVAPLLRLARERPSNDALIALGLLGDVSVLGTLVASLSDARYATSAALALYFITGAELSEVVPAPIEPGEVHAQESAGDGGHQNPTDGQSGDEGLQESEPLLLTRHIGQSPELWTTWLRDNAKRFVEGRRYRLGEPYSPQALMRCFREYRLPLAARRLVVDEIAIRFRVDVPYAPDMLALQQLKALPILSNALEAAAGRGSQSGWAVLS